MDVEIKAWLYDILNAIHEIDSFFTDKPKEFIAYQYDPAVARCSSPATCSIAILHGKELYRKCFKKPACRMNRKRL